MMESKVIFMKSIKAVNLEEQKLLSFQEITKKTHAKIEKNNLQKTKKVNNKVSITF